MLGRSNDCPEAREEQGRPFHLSSRPLARGRWERKEPPLESAVGETGPSGSCETQTVKRMFQEDSPLEGLWRTEGQGSEEDGI